MALNLTGHTGLYTHIKTKYKLKVQFRITVDFTCGATGVTDYFKIA